MTLKEKVKELSKTSILFFDEPVQIKHSPHSIPFNFWGVCVGPDDELYVMDTGEGWSKVEGGEIEATLTQRINYMYAKN